MKRISLVFFFISLFSVSFFCDAKKVGSNTASSRQLKTFFPAADTDNLMEGFAVFERGLTLENDATTCSFDAFFPISGDVTLSGGTLTLLRDMELKNPFAIGPGTIDADSYAIEFPGNVSGIDIPTAYHTDLFLCVDTHDVGTDVQSLDWSHDDNYVAVGSSLASGHNELQIYYFDGDVLTLTLSQDLGESAFAVRWHPSDYYLAVGQSSGGTELDIYYFNIASGTLEAKGSADTGTIYALSWDPTGDYLAVGRSNNSEFLVYEVALGVPGTSYTATYSSFPSVNRTVQKNAIDWDSTSSYIAVGLNSSSEDSDLKVFYFSGSALSENVELEVGNTVYGVKWLPASTTLAIAQNTSSNRLRLYEHDGSGGTLTEITSAQVNDGQTIYGIDWSYDGTFLGLAKRKTNATHEVRIFSYDADENRLSLVSGAENSTHVKCISWANNNYYLVVGDLADNLKLFKPTSSPLCFKNARLFFKSDVTFRGPIVFEGECLVNGGSNTFDFTTDGLISIAQGSTLVVEDARIKGLSANKISCQDDDGLLILSDVDWYQDSVYSFSVGALQFENDVAMGGDTTFVYATSKTSTLLAKSELHLDVGFTFSYDPGIISKTLLEFENETSKLTLDGATLHATVTGMQLTKGQLRVTRDSSICAETLIVDDGESSTFINECMTFGDGTAQNDLECDIYSGVTLNFTGGTLNYRNVSSASWQMHNVSSMLYMHDSAWLNLYESMNFGNGILVLGSGTRVGVAFGKTLVASKDPRGPYATVRI